MTPGMLVKHEQLGIGKVIDIRDGDLQVAFLFFWPTVMIKEEAVEQFVPSDEFKWALKRLTKGD